MNKRIHELTRERAFRRDYVMTDQFRRASLSVMNNVAEGFERYRRAEFLQFLSISKGSAGEIRSMLYAALDVGHINQPTFEELLELIQELGSSLGSFRSGLERSAPKPSVGRRKATVCVTQDAGH
ncbi:MAG: four helix bundle protein [Phycisphaeraceae bacterium]|nr:four helix bundle protein [Phycisphaeraceae bacterium]